MKNIIRSSVLGKDQVIYKNCDYKISPYIIQIYDNDKYIFNNILTSEIIIYDSLDDIKDDYEYLIRKWFYFNENLDPKSFVDGLLSVENIPKDLYNKKLLTPDNYIIFTTMDCNARCPYCYEEGIYHDYMSNETSLKVAEFIKNHYKSSDEIKLDWFGGEPLCNTKAIDLITNYLYDNNIPYTSGFTSNGYLFNNFSDYTLLEKWHMVGAQITLDGDSNIYNKIKNYKNNDKDAFNRVIENIDRLLNLGINISARINISIENLDYIDPLLELLCIKFKKFLNKNLEIYFSPLFEGIGNPPMHRSLEEKLLVSNKIIESTDLCNKYGCHINLKDYKKIEHCHCSADRPASLTINPKGEFVICEHYFSSSIGNVYTGIEDISYKTRIWESSKNFELCSTCFKYPRCRNSINCPIENVCCDESNIIVERHRIENFTKMIVNDWRNCHES